MNFWNSFLRRIYLSFRSHTAAGLSSLGQVFAAGYERNRFAPEGLDDLSLLLLSLARPPHPDLVQQVQRLCAARGLHLPASAPYVRDLFDAITPYRATEVVTLFHGGDVQLQGQAAEILTRQYAPRVREFVGRLSLRPPAELFDWSLEVLGEALGAYSLIPLDTIDFVPYLFRRVLSRLAGAPGTGALPDPRPRWFGELPEAEQALLEACHTHLNYHERARLYLSFYARLDVPQIALALGPPAWTEDEVLAELVRLWLLVL